MYSMLSTCPASATSSSVSLMAPVHYQVVMIVSRVLCLCWVVSFCHTFTLYHLMQAWLQDKEIDSLFHRDGVCQYDVWFDWLSDALCWMTVVRVVSLYKIRQCPMWSQDLLTAIAIHLTWHCRMIMSDNIFTLKGKVYFPCISVSSLALIPILSFLMFFVTDCYYWNNGVVHILII